MPVAQAASPREELLHLVPEDVGFCLVLENLSTHGKALANSPFVDQFRSSPLGATIRNAPETEKLTALDQFLQKYLDLTAAQLCDEILGDALVVAYRPGPPGKPEEEEGLFLLRARDARLLARLVERIQSLQKESGDLQDLEERTYRGEKYFRRLEGKGTTFYCLHGPLFAFASREGILRQLIDRLREANDAESPVARQFRLLGVGKSLAALWINPRAFDAALQQNAAAAVGVQAVALRTLLVYWKALEGIALSVALEKDLAVSVAVRASVEQMPPSARQLLRTAEQPSEVWQRFPEDALLTAAGRLDIPALVEMVAEFFAPDAQKSLRAIVEGTVEAVLGRNMVQHILPNLGPDWGICLFAPPAGGRGWMPQVLGALRVRPGSMSAPVDLAVLNALNALATLAVFHHNGGQPGPLSLKSLLQDRIEVKYLVNDEQFPQGLQPAFALNGGYLIVASSPDAIRRFRTIPAQTATEPAADVLLLTLSLRGWCQFLRERREPILEYAAAKNQVSKEEAGRRMDHLLVVLQLLDRVELTQRSGPDRVTLTLRVQTAKPLR
ncbi:MAG TPA: DUF3352 domain-containing protein [Gemmataceae bacterium]|nr:DUF3352 domain-containing protein [Gemmataceae bacterium]